MGMGLDYKLIKLAEEHGTINLLSACIRRHAQSMNMTEDDLQAFLDRNLEQLDSGVERMLDEWLEEKRSDEASEEENLVQCSICGRMVDPEWHDHADDDQTFDEMDGTFVDQYPTHRDPTPEEVLGWQQQDLIDQHRFER